MSDAAGRIWGPATFDEARRDTNIQGLKAATLSALVVVSSFALVEYYQVPDHFWVLQGLRGVCLAVLAAIAVAAFRSRPWTVRHVDLLTIGAFLACGWYSITLMVLHDGYDSAFFLTLVFIIVGVGAVTLWPLKTAVLYMLLIILSYLAPLALGLADPQNGGMFPIHLSFLLGMAIISVVAQQLRYRIEEREFLTSRSLEQTKASLEVAYDRLKELDQLKTDFFANVSHELRTPLTLSLGPLESLLRERHRPDVEEQLEGLRRNQLRLLRLINQLLDFAKVESGGVQAELAKVDVAAMLRGLVGEVEGAAAAKGLELELDAPSEPVWLYVDHEKLEQALLNLLSNAFKFTPKGGRITVELAELEKTAEIRVSDTGIGISPEKIDTIFDRFAQADSSETRRYAGTGIGLSLVKSHVELHGGTVEVKSEPDEGTSFMLSIPRGKIHLQAELVRERTEASAPSRLKAEQLIEFLTEPAEDAPPAEASEEALPLPEHEHGDPIDSDWVKRLFEVDGEKPRVLVVDDAPDMRRYLSSILTGNYEVRTARDGAEGLREAMRWDPDLVVSDVMMPVMSGSDLCRAIKRAGGRLSRTPVILVTARAAEQSKLRGLGYGADDYLLKPFLQDELLLRVRNLVSKRRQERALFDAHLTLRAQHEYLLSDLELARSFQDGLLSELDMPEPLAAHVEFHPADVVGGDFYHLTSLGPSRVRLFMADMVDHGVKAAVRAAAAWPEYTSLDHPRLGPSEVLERLNDVATSKYADLSGSFICLDLDTAVDAPTSVRYAQAGEMPFVVMSNGALQTPPPAEGFVVGLFPGMSYESLELSLAPGTRLFLYSDGLYTQPDETGRTFREGGLKEAWKTAMGHNDIREATEEVIESMARFRGMTDQLDDVTLIGIEVGK